MKSENHLKVISFLMVIIALAYGNILVAAITGFIAAKVYPTHTLGKSEREVLTKVSNSFIVLNTVLCVSLFAVVCYHIPTAVIDYDGFVFVAAALTSLVVIVLMLFTLFESRARTITLRRLFHSSCFGVASIILLWGLSMQMNNAFSPDFMIELITFVSTVVFYLFFIYKELCRISFRKIIAEND